MEPYEEWAHEDLVARCYQLEKQLRQAVARASENSWELDQLREDKWREEQFKRSEQGIYG